MHISMGQADKHYRFSAKSRHVAKLRPELTSAVVSSDDESLLPPGFWKVVKLMA